MQHISLGIFYRLFSLMEATSWTWKSEETRQSREGWLPLCGPEPGPSRMTCNLSCTTNYMERFKIHYFVDTLFCRVNEEVDELNDLVALLVVLGKATNCKPSSRRKPCEQTNWYVLIGTQDIIDIIGGWPIH